VGTFGSHRCTSQPESGHTDKKGILADISAIMAKRMPISFRQTSRRRPTRKGISHFTIEVENYKQLQEIMGAIKRVKNVLLVERD
jgi:(p)ppGpp synthase/HD superfamily hydrolase